MFKILLYILVLIYFTSCEVCGVKSEPTVNIYINSPSSYPYKTVKTLGTLKESNSFSNIPLNLNSTSTTYIFENPTKNDTLTLFYQVVLEDKGGRCGYILDIKAPNGPTSKSTFKNVRVDYLSYYYQRRFFGSGEGGISVQITL